MRSLILFALLTCCVATPIAATGCSSPAIKNAEHAAVTAGEVCAKQDASALLQPLEGEGVTLLGKVASALLAGGGMSSIDAGIAQAKSDLSALPTAIEQSLVDCAVKTVAAAWSPLAVGRGFAGGDARATAAAKIADALLAEHNVK